MAFAQTARKSCTKKTLCRILAALGFRQDGKLLRIRITSRVIQDGNSRSGRKARKLGGEACIKFPVHTQFFLWSLMMKRFDISEGRHRPNIHKHARMRTTRIISLRQVATIGRAQNGTCKMLRNVIYCLERKIPWMILKTCSVNGLGQSAKTVKGQAAINVMMKVFFGNGSREFDL